MTINLLQQNDLIENTQDIKQIEMHIDANSILDYAEKNNLNEIHASMLLNQIPDPSKGNLSMLSEDKITLLLEFLKKRNLLTKTNYGVVHTCPACNSLISYTSCGKCGSQKNQKLRKIIHKKCGHINYLENFINETGLKCPKCGDKINYTKDGGITGEYRFCDVTYECLECGSQTSNFNSNEKGTCSNCERTFRKKHTKIYDLTIYTQNACDRPMSR